jgi:hypothetical protein
MKRALLVLLPFTIIYAIVSSIGAPGNHYGPPTNPSLVNNNLPNHNSN